MELQMPKKRLRFVDFDEITLLREVLSLNPFENGKEWEVVQEHVFLTSQKKFSIRTLKDHVERITKAWLENAKVLKSRSGIEEPHSEKDDLCQNIFDLMDSFKKEKRTKSSKAKVETAVKRIGEADRNKWASQSFSNITENNSPVHVKPVDTDHSYFEPMQNMEYECQEEEIIIEAMDDPEELAILGNEYDPNPSSSKNVRMPTSTPSTSTQGNTSKILVIDDPEEEANTIIANVATSTPLKRKSSKILAPVRSRVRKTNVQRQGLTYLQKYDVEQNLLKEKQMKLEERKLALEEKKFALQNEESLNKAALVERQMALTEYETKKKLDLEERKIKLAENKIKLEIEDKQMLKHLIERQDKIINLLLNKDSE